MRRLTRLAIGLVTAICPGCTAPVVKPADTAPDQTVQLSGLFHALHALEAGSVPGQVPILQIGDSHTANDAFSGQMRRLMQARFGDAGRGMLPPGIPFRLYHPAQVTVTASGWTTIGSLQTSNPAPFGISGVRQVTTGRATMTLHADRPDGFDAVVVEALAQPGGGTIEVTAGTAAATTLRTVGSGPAPLWLSVPARGADVTIRTRGDGPVTILSWTAQSRRRGVTWSNLGTIGATIDTFARFDAELVSAELRRLQPALILVAFGTNEGFKDSTDPHGYEARYAAQLRALHAEAPGAAILIVGPPDGTRRGAGERCAGEDAATWSVPPRLPDLREAQRRVARAEGFYFWDWSAAMGGPCSIVAWARTDPPMAAADHVHLLTPGYRATADKLFDELMHQYDQYREQAHPG
jgi:lysophospholipase L1-like esterase